MTTFRKRPEQEQEDCRIPHPPVLREQFKIMQGQVNRFKTCGSGLHSPQQVRVLPCPPLTDSLPSGSENTMYFHSSISRLGLDRAPPDVPMHSVQNQFVVRVLLQSTWSVTTGEAASGLAHRKRQGRQRVSKHRTLEGIDWGR